MRDSGAGGASRLGAMASRPRTRFERVLGWMLAAALGVSVGQGQFPPMDHRMRAEEERATAEHERRRQLKAAYEARRARAHARLGSAASSVEPQALCPAFVGPSPATRTFGTNARIPIGLFVPRSARRPTTPRLGDAAPASESPASLFSNYISQQVVQARCINCHVEGGVSGHTRLVLTPSSTEGHESLNLAVLENLVASVEGAADLILNKIQGVGHGGGIQVPAGSADFANMERFLRLLSGESSSRNGLSPETLFAGVTMASPAKTLRRAALIFAGRLPTRTELNSVNDGQESSLRRTIRSLMTGPGFHEFLVRASNDRLLTERHLTDFRVLPPSEPDLYDLNKKYWEIIDAASADNLVDPWHIPAYRPFQQSLQHGVARAPLELIAHVVENDLPYTEILTADYIMANPVTAEGYGAKTEFENIDDATEFKPSKIASYFRTDDSKITEYDVFFGHRIINPGNLSTNYPHSGILNTTVFLRRYPTTATNRNRARSRWTYYHFLGVDIEKSASRTTDPEALAATDNPTMKNSACTVCHSVLDPVAGTFQNYGDNGLYRDQWGGFDSLAQLYKYPDDGTVSPYQEGDTWYRDMREPGFDAAVAPDAANSLQWLAQRITADDRFAEAAVKFWWPAIMGVDIAVPPEDERDHAFEAMLLASTAQAAEVSRLANAFRSGIAGGRPYDARDLLAEITLTSWFRADSVTGQDPVRDAALRHAGVERLLTPEELKRKTEAVSGFAWGRRFQRMSDFGVGIERSKLKELKDFEKWRYSYGLLYGGIDSDGVTERTGEVTPLMAAVAQSHAAEVSCPIVLREFYLWPDESRRLFGGIDPAVTPTLELQASLEITATPRVSFQTVSVSADLPPGAATLHLGFGNATSHPPLDRNLLLDRLELRDQAGDVVDSVELESLPEISCGGEAGDEYRLWSSCPFEVPVTVPSEGTYRIEVVARQEAAGDGPAKVRVAGNTFDVTAEQWDERQTIGTEASLAKGRQSIVLEFENDFWRSARIYVDGVVVRSEGGHVVQTIGSDSFRRDCDEVNHLGEADLNQWDNCSLKLAISVAGTYEIELTGRKRYADMPLTLLGIRVESSGGGRGERAIRRKLVELHKTLLGVTVATDSPDVEAAYSLFTEAWQRKRSTEGSGFWDSRLECAFADDHLYFQGLVADYLTYGDWGGSGIDWERVDEFLDGIEFEDPHHAARAWVVTLAYLLTDYRYLYF